MHTIKRLCLQLLPGVVLLAASSGLASANLITVAPTVTGSAGSFTYAYAISSSGADDTFLIDISVPKGGIISNIMTPTGFKSAYDSGLGIVSFLENTNYFSSTPLSGFSFLSPSGPGTVSFQASTLSAVTGNIITSSGATLAPVSAAATPEPGYAGLLGLIALFAIVRTTVFPRKSSKSLL